MGTEVVRNWLRGLPRGDRNAIGQDIMRLQFRWPIGMPFAVPWATVFGRCEATFRIARVLFSAQQGKLLVLHGFIKKTQKTPDEDLALARKRNREFES